MHTQTAGEHKIPTDPQEARNLNLSPSTKSDELRTV
ncbi:hypothetical protein FGRMN_7742, partial [Fusarium graminum]